MAGTVASPLLDSVCDRLDSHVSALSKSTDFIQIRLKLEETRAFLEDSIAERGGSDRIPSLRIWLTVLRDLAYDIDVLIDNWEQSAKSIATCTFPTSVNTFKFDQEVRRIHGRLVRHLNLLNKLVPVNSLARSAISQMGFQGSDQNVVFGRDFEICNIINTMLPSNMISIVDEKISRVIPIVGMGGIGKTVLAQRIFNDEKVKSHFQLRAWFFVGENLDVAKLKKAVTAEYFKTSTSRIENVLMRGEVLALNRFLIVLDDVWDEDGDKIEELKSWFEVGDSGSCVLVTTRSTRVADLMGTFPGQHLSCLSDKDSWSLFKHSALVGREQESAELEEIGRDIVAKCKGWPLAIVTVGGLLRLKNKQEWLSVAHYGLWILRELNSYLLPVLKRSYDHLPLYLKQCFAFCSLFPKDYWINKEKLVQLWIAEGFVRLKNDGSKGLEDIANDYFNELLQHSFFHDIVRDDFGEVLACKIHDFVHDLAARVAGLECSHHPIGDSQIIHRYVQHCSVFGDFSQSTILEKEKLRTLLLFSGKLEFGAVSTIFQQFSCLRALDLSQSGLIQLPATVGSLRHLRYLDLSHTYIRKIPESISKLKHLQTLELSNCYNLEELPKTIPQLTNLRILSIGSCCSLMHMPSGIGKLRLLRKLPVFILSKRHHSADLAELNSLNLEGRLDIKNLENVEIMVGASVAKLHEKVHIHSLGLSWNCSANVRCGESVAHLAEMLRPPQDLKVLDLKGYGGYTFPSWINSGLPNLVKLSLINCSCSKLPPLGQLLKLKDLYMRGLAEVQIIGLEFYGNDVVKGFASLRQLEIYDMPNLVEWESLEMEEDDGLMRIEPFPCLEKLILDGCNKLNDLPYIPNLKNLALCGSSKGILYSLFSLPSLPSLVIDKFQKLKFPPGNHISINSIVKLTIHECDTLEALFEIVQSFSSLRHLSIIHCSEMDSLPMSLKRYKFLQKLDIVDCPGLCNDSDVISQLSSLEELKIEDCPNLRFFPESIGFLSHILRLVIKRCPELERQLEQEEFDVCVEIDDVEDMFPR